MTSRRDFIKRTVGVIAASVVPVPTEPPVNSLWRKMMDDELHKAATTGSFNPLFSGAASVIDMVTIHFHHD